MVARDSGHLYSRGVERCRVLLADDSLIVRAGVEALLASEPDIELVATAGTYDEVLAATVAHRPDVVVTDVRMPPTGTDEGIRVADHLGEHHPGTGVVVLSQHADPSYLHRLVERGSGRRGYLLKDNVASPGELRRAITLVWQGGSFIDPVVVESLVQRHAKQDRSLLRSLTPREHEVLAELAAGKSNTAIAAALFIGERAVEKHINAIFAKLGLFDAPEVNRRVQAVLAFLDAR